MYEGYFGLKEAPFNITPDPRYVFFSKKHLEAFSNLLYGIENRKGFIAITGEVGAGKTTLCRVLLEELKGRAKTSVILNPNLSDTELMLSIVQDFGIKPATRGRKDCFDSLNRFVLEQAQQGLNVVLIIDEAQDLKTKSLEQIRLLSNLETDSQKLMQIVLMGQPELKDTLSQPSLRQLRQRISVWYHLTTLNCEETAQYIAHRLKVAGLERDISELFSPQAIETIFMHSEGVPRITNVLCDRALLAAYVKGLKFIDADIIQEADAELEGIASY